MKDSYYFPHDYHARHDEKMLFIKSKYGMVGHGIYWILIEMMHEQDDGKLTCALMEGISKEYNIDITVLQQFYEDAIRIGLFKTDKIKYWSVRVLQNKRNLELQRKRRSIAGKLGMAVRWGKPDTHNNVITNHNKKSKVKESKVKKSNSSIPVTDIDFINSLKQNPAYKGIDIDKELAKMDAWCMTHKGRIKTKRFIVNWLNKIDVKPVDTNAKKEPTPDKACDICGGTGKVREGSMKGGTCLCVKVRW